MKMWAQIVSHMETVEIIFDVAYKLDLINQVSSLVVIVSCIRHSLTYFKVPDPFAFNF